MFERIIFLNSLRIQTIIMRSNVCCREKKKERKKEHTRTYERHLPHSLIHSLFISLSMGCAIYDRTCHLLSTRYIKIVHFSKNFPMNKWKFIEQWVSRLYTSYLSVWWNGIDTTYRDRPRTWTLRNSLFFLTRFFQLANWRITLIYILYSTISIR